jgi:hypothetical protein
VSRDKLNIAIVGLGFGKEFIPIYQNHPNTTSAGICAHESAMQNARKIALPDFRTEIAVGAH